MDHARWALIKDVFDRLVSHPPDEQAKALLALESGDPDLRNEVARLLAHAPQGSTFVLDGRAVDLLAADSGPEPSSLGRFAIKRRLGAGGMGVVYDAFDPLRGDRVALKALTRITAPSIALFKREFRSLADMHHPNLVTLFDLFEHDHRWFFTMEFIDGHALLDYLGSAVDRWDAVRRAVGDLAAGLEALHKAGKLHRDLKPGNVIVRRDGRVVILDFGLVADLRSGQSSDTARAGTLTYMSPEQAAGAPLTAASDGYALGIMIFEALTGHRPPIALVRQEHDDALLPTAMDFGPFPDDLADICTSLLRLRPDARPSMLDVLERLQLDRPHVGRPSPVLPTDTARAIVGRESELRILEDAFQQSRTGPVIVALEGQSGVGKTALALEWLSGLRKEPSTLVLESRCYERESISFNVFDSLSDDLSARLQAFDVATLGEVVPEGADLLGRMFPRLAWLTATAPSPVHVDPQQLRRAGHRAFRDLLRNLSRRAGLVVFVDDVQWSDVDSAELLVELLRDSAPPSLLLILSYRAEARARRAVLTQLLDELRELTGVQHQSLNVGPLGPEATLALANSRLAAIHTGSSDEAMKIARESRGNPYFLEELAQYAQRLEQPQSESPAVGVTLASVIHARAERLPGAARRLLETVSIAGRPIRSADALATLAADRSPTWLALLRMERFVRTLVDGQDEFVEPFHDRLRETIAENLSPIDRRHRHHTLAAALEQSGSAEPELLAVHFEGAGEGARAGGYYVTAAERASRTLAFNSSASHYEKALQLATWPENRRVGIVRARAEALANAGRAYEAAQSYHAASEDGSPAGIMSSSRAGYHFAASGRITEAKQAFADVNARLRISIPLETKFAMPRLLAIKAWLGARRYRFRERAKDTISPMDLARIDACWFVGAGLGLVELMTGALFTTCALQLALRSGDTFRIARGLTWEGAIAASQSRGGKKQALVLFDVCRDIVDRLQDPYCTAMLALCEGLADFSGGRWADARTRMDRAEALFTRECVGVSYELATLNGFKLQTCVYSGAFRELREITPPLLDAARSTSDLYSETFIRGAILPLLHLADDRPDLARGSIETALGGWTSPGYHLQHALIDQVRVCVEGYAGKYDEAVALLEHQWPHMNRAGLLFNHNLRAKLLELRGKYLVASVLSGTRPSPKATKRADDAVRRLEREREPYWQGSVFASRSLIARAARRSDVAEPLLERAVEAYAAAGMRDYSAASALRLAEWRSDSASMSQARQALQTEDIQNAERWAQMRTPAPLTGGAA